MNYTAMRKLLLKVFIGFLSVTAVAAIVSVLSQKFGEIQFKVLATAFSITAGSICAMSCAAFLEKKRVKWAGHTGILTAGIAVAMAIGGLWGKIETDEYWKTTATIVVVAIAFAHACLLYLPNLPEHQRWIRLISTILIPLLALQIIFAICGEIKEDGYFRFMAALAVLVVLVTLIIPICSKLGKAAEEPLKNPSLASSQYDQIAESLILRKVSGGVFADEAGRRYQVTEIKAEPAAPPNADAPPGA